MIAGAGAAAVVVTTTWTSSSLPSIGDPSPRAGPLAVGDGVAFARADTEGDRPDPTYMWTDAALPASCCRHPNATSA